MALIDTVLPARSRTTGDLRTALRLATRDLHDRAELALGAKDILASDSAAGRASLIRMLRVQARLFAAWEFPMILDGHDPIFRDYLPRLPMVLADLKRLGANLDRCEPFGMQVLREPEAIGVLYVFEGATLGGKTIDTALRAQGVTGDGLELEPVLPGGPAYARARWRSVVRFLASRESDCEAGRQTIAAAKRIFEDIIAFAELEYDAA